MLLKHRVVDPATGCWLWQRATSQGYGVTWVRELRRNVRVTHMAMHLWRGMPLDGKQHVLHRCDNPPCFNPDHLFSGTQADNLRDMWAKGRGFSAQGDKHSCSLLTEPQALEILRRFSCENHCALAREFGVSHGCVMSIGKRRTWKHLTAPTF